MNNELAHAGLVTSANGLLSCPMCAAQRPSAFCVLLPLLARPFLKDRFWMPLPEKAVCSQYVLSKPTSLADICLLSLY